MLLLRCDGPEERSVRPVRGLGSEPLVHDAERADRTGGDRRCRLPGGALRDGDSGTIEDAAGAVHPGPVDVGA